MKIWLDDQLDDPNTPTRHTPEGYIGVKRGEDFKKLITDAHTKNEPIEIIHLDNDLDEETEGYQLLEWLKDTYPEYVVGTTEIQVHSENNVRKKYMKQQLEWWRAHKEEILEMKGREHPFGEMEPKIR
ncbi:MAG: hypothetical protein Q7K44_02715 [Candidatus Liptonbacteria bacterium]|nr:hypothetical protein [Candidatus Liptonbacteria bacterium]